MCGSMIVSIVMRKHSRLMDKVFMPGLDCDFVRVELWKV